MNAPDKIFIDEDLIAFHCLTDRHDGVLEYLHKGLVDEMVKSAEDHAYFAGQEKFREKLLEWINKMCQENKGFSEAELVVTLDKLKEKIESL